MCINVKWFRECHDVRAGESHTTFGIDCGSSRLHRPNSLTSCGGGWCCLFSLALWYDQQQQMQRTPTRNNMLPSLIVCHVSCYHTGVEICVRFSYVSEKYPWVLAAAAVIWTASDLLLTQDNGYAALITLLAWHYLPPPADWCATPTADTYTKLRTNRASWTELWPRGAAELGFSA